MFNLSLRPKALLQVVLAARCLLCVPSAALSALCQHELLHLMNAIEEERAGFTAQHRVHGEQQVGHQNKLRPSLIHPTQKEVRATLVEAEAARQSKAMNLAKQLARDARQQLPELSVKVEKRLGCALRQVAEILDGCVLPDDLIPADEGDDSLADIKVRRVTLAVSKNGRDWITVSTWIILLRNLIIH